MIDFFKDYILTLCVVASVSGILTLLTPDSKFEKPLKFVISIFLLICIVSPFVKGDALSKINWKFEIENNNRDFKLRYDDVWNETGKIIKETIIENIDDIIYTKTGQRAVKIDINIITDKKSFKIVEVIIIISDSIADKKDTIAEEIKNRLGIDKSVINFK